MAMVWACNGLSPEVEEPNGSGGNGDSGSTMTDDPPSTDSTGDSMPDPETADGDSGEATGCMEDDDCSDGVFCNGQEICDPSSAEADAQGCVPPAGSACPTDGTRCDERQDMCLTLCDLDADADDDGVDAVECGGTDCDDSNADVHPGLEEVCDAADLDEDCDPSTFGTLDVDDDGMVSNACCNGDNCGPDCNDAQWGLGVGDWAHCASCGDACSAQQACEAGTCVTARRVFITSSHHDGAMGGLFGADAICQARADEASLGGTFRAYMVDSGSGLDRLEHPTVPFVRLDGVRIADDWNDLADESIQDTLTIAETRQSVGGNAWTGLQNQGAFDSDCDSWTFNGGGCLMGPPCGGGGESSQTNNHWDGFYVFHCDSMFRLYCIEQ